MVLLKSVTDGCCFGQIGINSKWPVLIKIIIKTDVICIGKILLELEEIDFYEPCSYSSLRNCDIIHCTNEMEILFCIPYTPIVMEIFDK